MAGTRSSSPSARRGRGLWRIPPGAAERFWRYVSPEPNTGCWLWLGSVLATQRSPLGYPQFTLPSGPVKAHRFSFVLHGGRLRPREQVHHTCGVSICVNPAHLAKKTALEHAAEHRRDTCAQGHLLTPENTYMRADHPGARRCRICARRYDAARAA